MRIIEARALCLAANIMVFTRRVVEFPPRNLNVRLGIEGNVMQNAGFSLRLGGCDEACKPLRFELC